MMLRLDHVQLAIPAGSEALCRSFYVDVLGMKEIGSGVFRDADRDVETAG